MPPNKQKTAFRDQSTEEAFDGSFPSSLGKIDLPSTTTCAVTSLRPADTAQKRDALVAGKRFAKDGGEEAGDAAAAAMRRRGPAEK